MKRKRSLVTPNVQSNHFGDTLVRTEAKVGSEEMIQAISFVETWLQNPDNKEKKILVLQGFPPLADLLLLGFHPPYGILYGNKLALQSWPRFQKGEILGAVVVVFLSHQDKLYWLLVKIKRYDTLVNPGGMCDEKESFRQTAVRELQEETGLSLKQNTLRFLREWSCVTHFSNLRWKTRRQTFFAVEKVPETFEKFLCANPSTNPVIQMDIPDNPEISQILFLDVKLFQSKKKVPSWLSISATHFKMGEKAFSRIQKKNLMPNMG